MNAPSAESNAMLSSSEILKRDSEDIGWDYAVLVSATNKDRVKCKLCGKEMSGGVYRIKQHIAHIKGNVTACPKSTEEDKERCEKEFDKTKRKKVDKRKQEEKVKKEVNTIDEDDQEEEIRSRKKQHFLRPTDKSASPIDADSSMSQNIKLRQSNISETVWKEGTHSVHQYLARWVYEYGIPFHAIDNDAFKRFCEALGQFGPGYQPPSQYLLREQLLKEEVEKTKKSLRKQEEEWVANGCSIVTDAWSDGRRSIMNLCVNCKEGTTFLSSKEDSEEAHTAKYIFENIDKFIDEIGPQNVVQVVSDNASKNMAAAAFLKAKRPTIFWTSCATQTLNLMLETIGKQTRFKGVIEKAKKLTVFIYAHHKTLALMRKFTEKRDIVKPGVTRFATSFLTLQCILENKEKLRFMFSSDEWASCKWSKSAKGKVAYAIVTSFAFWNGITFCLKVFEPLVRVFRLVGGDKRPVMGFLYGELKQAKEEIKEAFKKVDANYCPILEVIDAKARGSLDSPLHLAAHFLNPYYFFKDPSIRTVQNDVMDAIFTCVETIFRDNYDIQNEIINVELYKYMSKEGIFGKSVALSGCAKNDENYDPVGWWSIYGNTTPHLQMMASKILSLTTSSFRFDRNWSTFEGIHTKKRNRLDTTRLNNLVYVQFNAKLINKERRDKEKEVDVLLASEASKAQGWIVEGGDDEELSGGSGLTSELVGDAGGTDNALVLRRGARNTGIRELYEEDFVSDEESEVEIDEEYD